MSKCTKPLVDGIPDFPMLDFPMDDFFLSGNFLMIVIVATRPLGWTVLIQPQDFETFDAPMTQVLCQLKTPIAKMPTGSR
jgi:hypothetical protein